MRSLKSVLIFGLIIFGLYCFDDSLLMSLVGIAKQLVTAASIGLNDLINYLTTL